jgi:diguanylate cyclase (GGDEF)-like protein
VLVLRLGDMPLGQRFTLFVIIICLTTTAILQILRALRVAERSETQLTFQALHDSLTGLPNRRMMERHLTGVLETATATAAAVGVLFIDIDRFKLINDTVGHTLGDELLVQVASRLQANVRPSDLVTRIGGDEFVVVLSQTIGVADALEFANRLRHCLRTPFDVDETEYFVTASIGLACAPAGHAGVSAEILVRDADTAMYRAKEAGRDAVAVFDDSMRAQLAERVDIERDLRHAVERKQLHVAFQPVVSASTGSIVSVEALIRWLHPTLGVIMPTRFIPLAEETGLIMEIGSWVLDEALRQVAMCRTTPGLEHLRVAVNLSAVQLGDELLVDHISRALSAHGLPGSALCLELTETVVMGDPETAMAAFAAIRRLDVQLAIDDFGTEYSSLAYLQRLPVDTLKIDRSFVDGLRDADSAADTLVAAIIAIAQALGMETVAEGVETMEQAKRLIALGCDSLQGYLYSRPVRADQLLDVVRLLSRNTALEAAHSSGGGASFPDGTAVA